jgi:hypothetical protein
MHSVLRASSQVGVNPLFASAAQPSGHRDRELAQQNHIKFERADDSLPLSDPPDQASPPAAQLEAEGMAEELCREKFPALRGEQVLRAEAVRCLD